MNRRSLLTAGAVLAAAPARAQADYPTRPVRLLVGFPPGGGVDLTARPLLPHLQPRLGQPVVVENRPGANGNLAVEAACKAPADGYTLLVGNTGPMAANHALYRSLPFDTQRDLTPVAQLISTPLVLVVSPALGVNSLQELLAMARARPGELNMGTGGNGGSPHLCLEAIKQREGLDIVHVPYRGSAPALQDLIGGRIQLMIDTYNLFRGAHEAGQVKVLAISSLQRHPSLPDVPTMDEAGLRGFESVGWVGLFAPAATPAPVLDKLEEAVRGALTGTDLPQTYLAQGGLPSFAGRKAFGDLVTRDRQRLGELIRKVGVSLD
ncbi:Bug family tripartite tricarboxylate transporter substrate binding protein [Pararoseomonas indoligenes]|uniref:Tripartite tricarboxylate transporter substrate binding protein n=1 Tax=Roseomonas indoligenes TaxID=2820811 RepID=A0A940MZT5_9PROT|nr:tripartite tricarboxylate transporter substrate binding protein [Pararoseomonas indoligenes]MBP0493899.1 tripartite tricarboxylate transporter substrate binding protein [Pararoseomonas indoligenes]